MIFLYLEILTQPFIPDDLAPFVPKVTCAGIFFGEGHSWLLSRPCSYRATAVASGEENVSERGREVGRELVESW